MSDYLGHSLLGLLVADVIRREIAVRRKPEPRPSAQSASVATTTTPEIDMKLPNIGHIVTAALGVVLGILIPGANPTATNDTLNIQQELANLFGTALTALANQLSVDTTGLTGMQKIFILANALVKQTVAQGFAGDVKALEAAALDVAQSAFRTLESDPEAVAKALAVALGATTGLTSVVTFATDVVSAAISEVTTKTATTAAAAPALQAA